MGRPPKKRVPNQLPESPDYSPELVAKILAEIAEGEPVNRVCRKYHVTPGRYNFWVLEDVDGLAARHARARQLQCDAIAQQITELSEAPVGSKDYAEINRRKLEIDTKKWLLAKLAPRQYGERQTIEHEGGGVPVTITTNARDGGGA